MSVRALVLFAVLTAFFLLALAVSRAIIVHGGKPQTTTGQVLHAQSAVDSKRSRSATPT
jgi:hypothetical protein